MELQVHLGQRLLQVLDMSGRIVQQSLALSQIGAQSRHLSLRAEAPAQQAIFVSALQPLCVADIGFSSRHVFGVSGVDQHNLEPALLQDLVCRDPVNPGRFHDHRLYPTTGELVRQPMKILGERLERPNRFRIAIWADRRHVHGGSNIDRRRSRMNRGEVPLRARSLCFRHCVDPPA
jgi:hypothetical protein